MFTGLIEGTCPVQAFSKASAGTSAVLTVELGPFAEQVKIGDSIAVNGVCLTVVRLNHTAATFELSSETLAKSNLGALRPGSKVNIERALKPTDRLGGHFVLGHVDGLATIAEIEKNGPFTNMTFQAPSPLLQQMIPKGSVAIDGISLTVAELTEKDFRVALIPETLKRTTLGSARRGQKVNVETDIIVKTIRQYLDQVLPKQALTVEKLKQWGF